MINADNLVGSTLSERYELLDKIGKGGMAVVYKAHDKVLDRDVAIKILRDSYESDSTVVSNFIREARSSASLVHPNVVSVYDVCEFDGLNYMVMELVDGITLKEYIKQHQRMPWQEACDYAIQIGQGIQAAHERGIIHRDIKPQNIIMAPGGVLKVTDFGIAKAMEADKSIAGGTAMGSVHYISPEQARGGYTDVRSDIYSLGIVLYEMLAGRVPFDGDSPVSIALMHIEEEPVNVKCVNLDVPQDLAYVTMKAMDREQSKRYQNTRELLEDLRAVLADEPLPSKESERGVSDGERSDIPAERVEEKRTVSREEVTGIGRNTRVKQKDRGRAKRKHAERNAVLLAFSTVAALLLIAAGIIIIMFKPFSKTVPDLLNLTLEEARDKADSYGYKISDELEYSISDDVPEDCVVSQMPAPGVEAKRSEPITLVISLGSSGGNIEVPSVINQRVEDAIAQIETCGLTYRLVTEYSDTVETGYTVRQTPEAGTHLNAGDTVTIHYSVGPDSGTEEQGTVVVPGVSGYSLAEAESAINQAGLILGSVSNRNSTQPEGTVINQSPAANTTVKSGTKVSLVISNGAAAAPPAVETAGTETEKPQPQTQTQTQPESNRDNPPAAQSHMYTVRIPSDVKNDTVNVQIVANGVTVHNATHSKSEGQVTVEIPDSGSVSIQAYIDGAKISDKTVTF